MVLALEDLSLESLQQLREWTVGDMQWGFASEWNSVVQALIPRLLDHKDIKTVASFEAPPPPKARPVASLEAPPPKAMQLPRIIPGAPARDVPASLQRKEQLLAAQQATHAARSVRRVRRPPSPATAKSQLNQLLAGRPDPPGTCRSSFWSAARYARATSSTVTGP